MVDNKYGKGGVSTSTTNINYQKVDCCIDNLDFHVVSEYGLFNP